MKRVVVTIKSLFFRFKVALKKIYINKLFIFIEVLINS